MRFILCLVLAGLVSGCDFRTEKNVKTLTAETWFQKIQRVTLEPSCVRCHSGAEAKKGVNLTSFQELVKCGVIVPGEPSKSRLAQVLRGVQGFPKMPPRMSCTEEEIQAVEKWIASGAEESAPLPEPGHTETPVTPTTPVAPIISEPYGVEPKKVVQFSELKKQVLIPNCLDCHSGEQPSAKLDLSEYNLVIYSGVVKAGFPAESKIFERVSGGIDRMPLDSEELSSKDIKLIYDWIKDGAHP